LEDEKPKVVDVEIEEGKGGVVWEGQRETVILKSQK
jgi:hypothetical protein